MQRWSLLDDPWQSMLEGIFRPGRATLLQYYVSIFLLLIIPLDVVRALATTGAVGKTSVYFDQSSARDSIDQACYTSPLFWETLDRYLPNKNWHTERRFQRFRGFFDNLRTQPPGEEVTLPNGQVLLSQYMFPGLNDDDDTVPRSPFPMEHYVELQQLYQQLQANVAPIAEKELLHLLQAKPLVNDDQQFNLVENDGDTWQRAAWYGWQFLSLRGATKYMPQTTMALHQAMKKPAHRFVGVSRQRPHCVGTVHSDGRNYLLSTLTPLNRPVGCGIVVHGVDATLHDTPVILDNTFLHHIYNHGDNDRFCLIAECWHPALTPIERNALCTLFAVKDQFTVLELALAPWGYDDDTLQAALSSGAVHDLEFWKNIMYTPSNNSRSSASSTSVEEVSSSSTKRKRKIGQQRTSVGRKGFGG
jgi:Aspartyl/Asparaginyl beta-hydroxylase